MSKNINFTRNNIPQPQQQFNVDLSNATQRKCHCGCLYFTPAVALYTVYALVSPTGTELIANQQVMICAMCKKVFGDTSNVK